MQPFPCPGQTLDSAHSFTTMSLAHCPHHNLLTHGLAAPVPKKDLLLFSHNRYLSPVNPSDNVTKRKGVCKGGLSAWCAISGHFFYRCLHLFTEDTVTPTLSPVCKPPHRRKRAAITITEKTMEISPLHIQFYPIIMHLSIYKRISISKYISKNFYQQKS